MPYRGASGECSAQPISSVDVGGGNFNGPPPRSQNAGSGPRRNTPQAAANLRYIGDQIIAEVETAQADDLARRHRLTHIGSQELPFIGSAISLFRIRRLTFGAYDPKGGDEKGFEYAKSKPEIVKRSMEEFSKPQYGVDVLKALKADESTRALPVVIMTSSHVETDLVKSYKLGVNSYVVKPVDFDKFAEMVTEVGLYWMVCNKTPGL